MLGMCGGEQKVNGRVIRVYEYLDDGRRKGRVRSIVAKYVANGDCSSKTIYIKISNVKKHQR